ncbi:MAG: hypothetical protein ACMUHX_08955 [bacterium]
MFNLLIFMIFLICLSLLCVFIANIKNIVPHGWGKRVVFHSKDHSAIKVKKEIEKGYKPYTRSDVHPSKANSWSVGVIGHS